MGGCVSHNRGNHHHHRRRRRRRSRSSRSSTTRNYQDERLNTIELNVILFCF